MANVDASLFTGLDEAETHPAQLPAGSTVLKITKTEVYSPGAKANEKHFAIHGKAVKTDSAEVSVGSTYSANVSFLAGGAYGNQTAQKQIREFLMAIAGAEPGDDPPGGFNTWADLAYECVTSEENPLEGDCVLVKATPRKGNPAYCNYKYLKAPAAKK